MDMAVDGLQFRKRHAGQGQQMMMDRFEMLADDVKPQFRQ